MMISQTPKNGDSLEIAFWWIYRESDDFMDVLKVM